MKNKFNCWILFISSGVFLSCNLAKIPAEKDYKTLERAGWLMGRWENNSPEGNASEIWTRENDSTYLGESYFVIGDDTVSKEKIQLTQRAGKVYYIPVMENQNGGKPVEFVLTSVSENYLAFENPQHDFPQKISYKALSRDSAIAEISGIVEGKKSAQQFPMSRVK